MNNQEREMDKLFWDVLFSIQETLTKKSDDIKSDISRPDKGPFNG
jgi:hypothetical protein